MLEALAWGPQTLLSRITVVLAATPGSLAQGALLGTLMPIFLCFLGFTPSLPFSRSVLIEQMNSWQLLLPDQCYHRHSNISCFIFPSDYFGLGFVFALSRMEFKKKFWSCFPSTVWVSCKCLQSNNGYLSSLFHLSGLPFPKSDWGEREGRGLD